MSLANAIKDYIMNLNERRALDALTEIGLQTECRQVFKETEKLRDAIVEGFLVPQVGQVLADNGVERELLYDRGE